MYSNQQDDWADKLTKLSKLRDDGVLSDEEFKALKDKIIRALPASDQERHLDNSDLQNAATTTPRPSDKYVVNDIKGIISSIFGAFALAAILVGVQTLGWAFGLLIGSGWGLDEQSQHLLGFMCLTIAAVCSYVLIFFIFFFTRDNGQPLLMGLCFPLFLLALWGVLLLQFIYGVFPSPRLFVSIVYPALVLAVMLLAVSLLSVRARAAGYIFDSGNEEITFPGGRISANRISDYFRPWYLLQSFKRFTISYRDIRNITRGEHWIRVNGNFGAVEFTFVDEAKLEELASAIVARNKMGVPVIVQS